MNFFEHQDQARRNTTLLIVLFGVAIASMILAFYIVTIIIIIYYILFRAESSYLDPYAFSPWQPGLLLMVSAGTVGVVGITSLVKILQLQAGGKVIARSMGGQQVDIQTQDEDLRRLLNVVEEMAIASGVPVPPVYVMFNESGINAFAAGFTINDAVIGVTRGCIEELTRDELQGVIAHEFSHILHGDMRLNLRIVGVLQGILILYLTGRVLLRGGMDIRGKAGSVMALSGLVLASVGGVGFLSGRLIKSAVSRQREFLADASAVQFTRNPHGISNALRKIGGYSWGTRLKTAKAEEASHMFFGTIGGRKFTHPLSTHPPLKERIRRLESLRKNATFMRDLESSATGISQSSGGAIAAGVMDFQSVSTGPTTTKQSANAPKSIHINPDQIVTAIGTTDPEHLAYAQTFLKRLPPALHRALRNAQGAQAVIYGLLLDRENTEVRDRQLKQLQQTETIDAINMVQQISEGLTELDPRARLPLVDLTVPALRSLSTKDMSRFFKQIQMLVRADGRLSLSEYTLQIVLQRRLQPYANPSKSTTVKHTTLTSVWDDCLKILAGLAQVGHTSQKDVSYAFRSGVYCLPGAGKHTIPEHPRMPGLYDIGTSLKQLAQTAPKVKQSFVDACAHTVLVDNDVTLREAELLRAIVISLDCPIPPFLDASTKSNNSVRIGR